MASPELTNYDKRINMSTTQFSQDQIYLQDQNQMNSIILDSVASKKDTTRGSKVFDNKANFS
jgi:hypothetical protein